MPQMNKGGKFIFGISVVQKDLSLQLPLQAVEEYHITSEGRVYLSSGSKQTGGFIVTRKELLLNSQIAGILNQNPKLRDYKLPQGELIRYKGRDYCWLAVSPTGKLQLTPPLLNAFELEPDMRLLSIRSSNIAFTMGAKGPLLKKAEEYQGEIPVC